MKPVYALSLSLALLLFASCNKDLSYEGGAVPPPVKPPITRSGEDQFKDFLAGKKFQLRAFYSDKPIDYKDDDSIYSQETDLWPYVAGYLVDDVNTFFANGTIDIQQNSRKKPGLPDEDLMRNYSVGTNEDGLYMDFLDYQYNPLQYHLSEYADGYFVLAVKWKDGATLFSRFEQIP